MPTTPPEKNYVLSWNKNGRKTIKVSEAVDHDHAIALADKYARADHCDIDANVQAVEVEQASDQVIADDFEPFVESLAFV